MDWARTGLLFSPSLSTPASSTFSFPSLIIIINRAIFGYHCVRSSVLWLPACRPGIFIWDTAVERSSLSIRMDYRNGHSLLLNTIYILNTQLRYDFQLTWLIAVQRYFPVGHLPFSLSSWWLLLLHWGASRRWILTPVLPSFLPSWHLQSWFIGSHHWMPLWNYLRTGLFQFLWFLSIFSKRYFEEAFFATFSNLGKVFLLLGVSTMFLQVQIVFQPDFCKNNCKAMVKDPNVNMI